MIFQSYDTKRGPRIVTQPHLPGIAPPAPPARRTLTAAIPAWLPQQLAAAVAQSGSASFSFSKGERHALRRRRPIPISEWAEKHRHLRERISSIPGRWHNLFAPYLSGIMDAAGFPGVEVLILCKTPQTGGTEAGHNIVGYSIDRAPGPVMYVFPDENTARENAKDRIIPMIEDSPRLREYLTGYGDDVASLRINLSHMPIYLGWSGSVARLGNKPIRILILDELDKYKNPKNEATSEALAEKRTTTWGGRGRLIFKLSTPTIENGPIWKAFSEEANCRFDYWVRCPHCNLEQLMKFEQITWSASYRAKLVARVKGEPEPPAPADEQPVDPEKILADRGAEYLCEHCGALWDDHDRDRAVRRGFWRERTSGLDLMAQLHTHRPLKVGFHLPAWLSYFVSLSEVAHAFLKYKRSGKLDDLKNFVTQYCAMPWKAQFVERREDSILALCDTRPRGIVPVPEESGRPPIAALLAAVDTQGRYFRYVIRAFAYGPSEESWQVQCGSLPDFEDIVSVLWKSVYRDGNGKEYRVRNAIIDAMGTRTKKVYAFCAKHRGRIVPYQGVQTLPVPIQHSPQEFLTDDVGGKIKIPGGVLLHRVNTKFFKDDLAAKLMIHPDDPGAFHLHCGVDANGNKLLEEYAREMCAEVWSDEEQAWINPHERPEHFWDCEVMLQALAYQVGIRNWKLPEEHAKPQPTRPMAPPPGPRRSAAERLAAIRR